MDYRLGDGNGLELMQEFIKSGIQVPIIVLTGKGDHDIDVLAMQLGAVDYLEKTSLESVQLERAIRYAIRNTNILKAMKKSEERLRSLSARILEAQENERKLVARDLHDSIGAGLTAVRFALEQKISSMGREDSSSHKAMSLERIMDMIREIIEETRRISSNLRPSILDNLGLLPAIRSLCRQCEEIHKYMNIEVQFDVREDDIPEKLKIVLYRVVQEAINNTTKHSGADQLVVRLMLRDARLELLISDNGKGFDWQDNDSNEAKIGGRGLQGMYERMMLSGGEITIDSQKGRGTSVRVCFPIS
jgi:signal transduction histidine kinase